MTAKLSPVILHFRQIENSCRRTPNQVDATGSHREPQAGRQPPCVRTVARKMLRVRDRVREIDQSYVPIVLEIGFCEGVMEAVRVEAHVGVVCEEQRAAGADSDIEFDSVVGVAIAVVVALRAPGPPFPIGYRLLGLSDPS